VIARSWKFESSPGHQIQIKPAKAGFFVSGAETLQVIPSWVALEKFYRLSL
jgi:hypothetical protein